MKTPGRSLLVRTSSSRSWCRGRRGTHPPGGSFVVIPRGTPGPWDAPKRLVAVGPYRWVRDPIHLAALAVTLDAA
jgi:hypothetical protein